MKYAATLFTLLLIATMPAIAELPDGYWPAEQTEPILDATLEVTLTTDLSHLTAAETRSLQELLAAGQIMHALYEQQLHADAHTAKQALDELHAAGDNADDTANLLDLYYLSKGPVVTTLENGGPT